jgi:type II secretory pathway pseudopilin PulG
MMLKTQLLKTQLKTEMHLHSQGFSLIEAIVALLIGTITLAVMGPLFTSQRLMNLDSEIGSGAKSMGVRCLEVIRQQDPASLAVGADFMTSPAACNFTDTQRTLFGRTYQIATRVRLASVNAAAMTNTDGYGSFECLGNPDASQLNQSGARCVDILVRFNGRSVYETSTVYTQVQ